MAIFPYSETEISYLSKRDKKLGEAICAVGRIEREVNPDLFSALINSIVGQQISTKAHKTVWGRMKNSLGKITPETIFEYPEAGLQGFGITYKKAAYIRGAAEAVLNGTLDIDSLWQKSDPEVFRELTRLNGVGIWTAEMLMLFSMRRPDILSFGDLAIQRGIRILYHHKSITRQLFEKYRRRYSPYGSTASLYLWAIAGGAPP